jgi:hypothetical protein
VGASEFITYQEGTDPRQAFQDAVENALFEHGRQGYTGTIAEKIPLTDRLLIIRAVPLPMDEARALAGDHLVRGFTPGGVTDSYGAVGAIAVCGARRGVQVTIPARPGGWDTTGEACQAALQSVTLPAGAVLCDLYGRPSARPCVLGADETAEAGRPQPPDDGHREQPPRAGHRRNTARRLAALRHRLPLSRRKKNRRVRAPYPSARYSQRPGGFRLRLT